MADTIHKKRKDYPHFDKFYVGTKDYADNYDRIFRNKKTKKKSKSVRKKNGIRQHEVPAK